MTQHTLHSCDYGTGVPVGLHSFVWCVDRVVCTRCGHVPRDESEWKARAEKAEAEAERLLSELAALHPRTVAAETALDRVRVVCDRLDEDPYDAWADATEAIRAAIEGPS